MRYTELLENKFPHPDRLDDEREIAEYIRDNASDYVDVRAIEEFLQGGFAVLKRMKLEDLTPGDPDHNVRDEKKEKTYSRMDPSTTPPLVVLDGEIIDGNHRYRVLRALGVEDCLVYDVDFEE